MTDKLANCKTITETAPRSRVCFDKDWHFRLGDLPIRYAVKAGMTGGLTDCGTREDGEWLDIAFVDRDSGAADPAAAEWRQLNLPHDWGVEGQYANDPGLGSRDGSHGYLPVGIGFYRKRFAVPTEDLGKRISLQFDGVTGRAELWLNGHLVGEHFGGASSFGYDIGDLSVTAPKATTSCSSRSTRPSWKAGGTRAAESTAMSGCEAPIRFMSRITART
ncbi:sugar-binding domain-containing protein [Paenibacillus glycinis]|uniref:Glycosyl hydrolases family 2 sugar binding domain-containing protein n=1 Tax=Paenibacillus glycinis TaxID=2697035 RepID=A0ABW9XLZ6_9BACL|nr:sugar-binding domain-containing protein [Paenibacillus glycinis]NBD23650.1 hypothetical protein [Paenibacillus glycinis]